MSSSCERFFVFLEVFSQEGGIQAYSQDLLKAYLSLFPASPTQIFLLRDRPLNPPPLNSGSLTYHYCKSNSSLQERLNLALALGKQLLLSRPQHVYCGHLNLAPLVRLLCQPLGIPYTILTYGEDAWFPPSPSKQKALHQAQAIWSISRYTRDRFCQVSGVNPSKVRILPCVVDGQKFTPEPKPQFLLDRYNLHQPKVLLTVGRLWSESVCPSKGVEGVLRALPTILAVYPEVRYVVIGRGDDQPRLEQLAADLGIREKVIFAGFVPDDELVAHYQLADAYLMPSIEGFGIAYLEAMACGVPVVAGNDDGSADPLQDGQLGWQVTPQDADAIAQATLAILAGSDRRSQGDWLRAETLKLYAQENLPTILADLIP